MKVYLAIATSLLVWSNAFLAIEVALRELTPTELVLLRFIPLGLASALYLVIAIPRKAWNLFKQFPLRIIAMAIFLVPGYNFFLYNGQQEISPALASLIIGSSPIFTYLLAIAVGVDHWKRARAAGLVLAFAGLYVAVTYGTGGKLTATTLVAAILVSLATMSASAFMVIGRTILSHYSQAVVVPFALALGGIPLIALVGPQTLAKLPQLSSSTWISLVFLMVFATVVGFYTWLYALSQMPVSSVAVFVNAIPFLTMIFGYLFFGQVVTAWLILGCVFLVSGVILTHKIKS